MRRAGKAAVADVLRTGKQDDSQRGDGKARKRYEPGAPGHGNLGTRGTLGMLGRRGIPGTCGRPASWTGAVTG